MLIREHTSTYTRIPFKKGKVTCPVCGRTHRYHCSVTVDDGLAICKNTWSEIQAQDGRYIHILKPNSQRLYVPTAATPKVVIGTEQADADRLNAVYCAMLSHLKLSPAHGDELLVRRGLSDMTIAKNLYASVPDEVKGNRLARALARFFDLKGIPGFYRQEGSWRLNTRSQGFYIPYRDERGRIVGLQIRRDRDAKPKYLWLSSRDLPDGTPASACLHFSKPDIAERDDCEILVTEGALKAECISDFTDFPVVALAGVTATSPDALVQRLLRALPRLKGVKVCFDMDWQEKPEVRSALLRLLHKLKETTLEVKGATWDIALGKGYDDYLFNIMGRTA
jgi:DNA primase